MPSIGDVLKLERRDLSTFPRETVDLIMDMQKEGWRGYRNNQGHVKMLAPDGETYVMATQNPNSPKYVRSKYNQYKKRNKQEEVNSSLPKTPTQKWPCARPACPRVYASEQQLNDHMAVDHEGLLLCPEKDCHETFKRPASLGLHRSNKHGYESPTKGKRAKQKANREAKKVLDDVIATVDTGEFNVREDIPILIGDSQPTVKQQVKEALEKNIPGFRAIGPDLTDSLPAEVLTPANVYRQTQIQRGDLSAKLQEHELPYIGTQQDARVGRTDDLHFLDDRDSWTLDLDLLPRIKVGLLEDMMRAAGLGMEIRVWREKK